MKTTVASITLNQILKLQAEAETAGDNRMAETCSVAYCERRHVILGRPSKSYGVQALEAVVAAINALAAR